MQGIKQTVLKSVINYINLGDYHEFTASCKMEQPTIEVI
jgi:hypothetical protein